MASGVPVLLEMSSLRYIEYNKVVHYFVKSKQMMSLLEGWVR